MLKWPNDLFVSGMKLAGILVESSVGENAFATAGIGLNVNHSCFPAPLDATATSLRLQAGASLDRNAVAAAILASIDESFSLIPNHFDQIVNWASHFDYLLGRRISVGAGVTVHEGIAEGLDFDGALFLRLPSGPVVRITSGEVTRYSKLGT